MNEGSEVFAATFASLDGQPGSARHEIRVDPRDLGLLQGRAGKPAQRPYAAVLGCSDARVPIEGPEHVDLDRVDTGLDRGREALRRVAGGDQVGPLVADQAKTVRH